MTFLLQQTVIYTVPLILVALAGAGLLASRRTRRAR